MTEQEQQEGLPEYMQGVYKGKKDTDKEGIIKSGKNKGNPWKLFEVYFKIDGDSVTYTCFQTTPGFKILIEDNIGTTMNIRYKMKPYVCNHSGETKQGKNIIGFYQIDEDDVKEGEKVSSTTSQSTPTPSAIPPDPSSGEFDAMVTAYMTSVEQDVWTLNHFKGTMLIIWATKHMPQMIKKLETTWAEKVQPAEE